MLLYLSAIIAAAPLAGAVTKLDAKSLFAARQRRLFTNEDGIKTLVGGTTLTKKKVVGSSFGNRAKRLDLSNEAHTASLDTNAGGITPSSTEFNYGDSIPATFDLRDEYISAAVLETLNVTNIGEWEVCLYMRMQNNDDSIFCTSPSIDGSSGIDEDTGLPTLDYTGSVEIPASSTTSVRLPETTYGTGFDLYVQDENKVKILGPGTFYLAKTEGMKAAEMVTLEINHPLAKWGHQKTKKAKYVSAAAELKSDFHVAELTALKGVGADMVIGTSDALASYALSTDKEYYKLDESVEVTWDITDGGQGGGRKLTAISVAGPGSETKLGRRESRQMKNVFGISGENKDGLNVGTLDSKNKDGLNVGTLTGATLPPPGPPQETTTATTTTSTHETTTPPPDIDTGDIDLGLEPEPMIDEDDITLYRLGIYPSNSNPQGGQLDPLLDYALCSLPCTTPPKELETGTWTFEIQNLPDPHPLTDGQYDVWVLNGVGDGIAGPVTWTLEE